MVDRHVQLNENNRYCLSTLYYRKTTSSVIRREWIQLVLQWGARRVYPFQFWYRRLRRRYPYEDSHQAHTSSSWGFCKMYLTNLTQVAIVIRTRNEILRCQIWPKRDILRTRWNITLIVSCIGNAKSISDVAQKYIEKYITSSCTSYRNIIINLKKFL